MQTCIAGLDHVVVTNVKKYDLMTVINELGVRIRKKLWLM